MISYLISFLIIMSIFQNIISTDYNFYTLSVQKWCTSEYQIHGLWPQYTAETYPSYCSNTKYQEPNEKLKYKMDKYWSSCNNSDLWEHEWLKHGTCTNNTESYYFNQTIELFLDNLNLINNCHQDECKLACFDLNYKLINCPL